MGTLLALLGLYTIFMAILYATALTIAIVTYIFQGISLSAAAKRRGIEKRWLAWVPIGNMWLLGSISDQYRYATQGVDRNIRKKLLWLLIVTYVLLVPVLILKFASTSTTITVSSSVGSVLSILMIIIIVPMLVVAAIATVYQYMALYDYFRSCAADKATLYLLLSIFVPFANMILMFAVRNKVQGLPPKTDTSVAEQI